VIYAPVVRRVHGIEHLEQLEVTLQVDEQQPELAPAHRLVFGRALLLPLLDVLGCMEGTHDGGRESAHGRPFPAKD
jgi:hypothetical protein